MKTCYVSCGCNKSSHCADWGQNNILCYGSSNAVVICQPETKDGKCAQIRHTLAVHSGSVNFVKWISKYKQGAETEMISGGVDKTVIVWQAQDDSYTMKQKLTGHNGPITTLDAAYILPENEESNQGEQLCTVIVSASVDSSVKIWRRIKDGDFAETQALNYGSGFALDVSLIKLPNTNRLMLACGCDDMKIHVYIEQDTPNGLQFTPVITLPGHEDWVRALDFTLHDNGDLLLASAAQDFLVRVWRFSERECSTAPIQQISILDLPLDKDFQMRETTLTFDYKGATKVYAVTLETVLSGHENWIYSVKWKPRSLKDGQNHQEMCLLSVSMDKTMILWRPDAESGVWMEQVRVGEVGGNTLGLYGGMFGPDGDSILAHGYQGAFHHWTSNQELSNWGHMVTVSGHFDSVEDIEWDKRGGNFLLSCSLDETVRLHAPWVNKDREVIWYEIARPQIHGYALQCIAMVNRYQYASGADEKVVRIFDGTDNFIENFCNLCNIDLKVEHESEDAKNRPVGASVPALGLSNKAIFSEGVTNLMEDLEIKPGNNEQYTDNVFTSVSLKAPPSEEHLLQNTLWPEVQKLYGHGYEIFSLACDPQGTILASACKASKAEFASVILWDTVTWQQLLILEGHSLTVTQMAFSHSGEYLLTVSRDRTWYLYRRRGADNPKEDPLFRHVIHTDKKTCVHGRIIWSCCWTHDDKYFLTASRDKKVVVWNCPKADDMEPKMAGRLDVADSATAVDTAPTVLSNGSYLVSVGLDNGQVLLYSWLPGPTTSAWKQLVVLDNNISHHLTVKRLRFRPCLGLAGIHGNDLEGSNVKERDFWLQLASCGMDRAVKIYNINLEKLT
ncbi:elongator complex protein 2-like [Mya arenaria]|uniref:elongator complex protein 2-like n=1 Tax=Mya arenaria TaxID=6604 RepID=UPI0022E00955|nr:elongator complex protein 2-like [Mya arenaria]